MPVPYFFSTSSRRHTAQRRSGRAITSCGWALLIVAAGLIGCAEPAAPENDGRFHEVVLDSTVTNPMEIDITDDGRVFLVERGGALKVWEPGEDTTYTVGFFPAYAMLNEGLMGMALDPAFEANGWIYLYYAPLEGGARNRISRVTVQGRRAVDGSENVLLEWPTQREACCHAGGSMAFGPDGTLFVGTGDNTDPTSAGLFSPIDERPGMEISDAQRTAGNTNDLRGGVIRIRPTDDGSYEIPDGNLFPPGTPNTRPEIYVMGARNAYRLTVDSKTGMVAWGEIGHGAVEPDPERGPAGHDEINIVTEAGFYGWPYFAADNKPFRDRDFVTGEIKDFFDPAAPINDSPNNTGLRELPPAQPATIWYSRVDSGAFPGLGEGTQTAIPGPIYRYDAATVHPNGLPERYDGHFIFADWMRYWTKAVPVDDRGRVGEIEPFMEELDHLRIMDLETASDGRLYAVDWGQKYFGFNTDARIVRIDYGETIDGPLRPAAERPSQPASRRAEPPVTFAKPENGTVFDWGEPIAYELAGAAESARVETMLLCDSHVHYLDTLAAATGEATIPSWPVYVGYTVKRNQVAVLDAQAGGEVAETVTGRNRVILQPRRKEAEHVSASRSAERNTIGPVRDVAFAQAVMDVEDEGYLAYTPVNLMGIEALELRVMPELGGTVELRLDAPDGPVLGTAVVDDNTVQAMSAVNPPVVPEGSEPPSIEGWADVRIEVEDPGGAHTLYLVFHSDRPAEPPAEGEERNTVLMRVDWFDFVSSSDLALR